MSEMDGRVAQAIYESSSAEIGRADPEWRKTPWPGLNADQKEFARMMARAAIAAMREPTEAMIAATDGLDIMWEYHWQGGKPGSPADAWRAMIDRALADE